MRTHRLRMVKIRYTVLLLWGTVRVTYHSSRTPATGTLNTHLAITSRLLQPASLHVPSLAPSRKPHTQRTTQQTTRKAPIKTRHTASSLTADTVRKIPIWAHLIQMKATLGIKGMVLAALIRTVTARRGQVAKEARGEAEIPRV